MVVAYFLRKLSREIQLLTIEGASKYYSTSILLNCRKPILTEPMRGDGPAIQVLVQPFLLKNLEYQQALLAEDVKIL